MRVSRSTPLGRLRLAVRTPDEIADLSGRLNQNPNGITLLELLKEDLETHDGSFLEPGFLVIAVHRLGNARMDVRPRIARAPLSVVYRALYTASKLLFGIDLEYSVKLGRRVRIWHHGGMKLGARSIGNDVHLRHNVTMGVLDRRSPENKPVIGDRVDVGAGAAILGAVWVGDDSVIGANSVVVRSFPPGSTVFGVPARPVRRAAPL